MRQHIMQQHHITEVSWKADELNTIEAMFICNALMGIVPVHSVEDMALSLFPVQQLIKQVIC
jgi:4-amino-4-deoxychorismate lyase